MKPTFHPWKKEMIKILRFDNDKANALPYMYAKPMWYIQHQIQEEEQRTIMKKITGASDMLIEKICEDTKKVSAGVEDYIYRLHKMNQSILRGMTLEELIGYLEREKYSKIKGEKDMPTKEFDLGKMLGVEFFEAKVQSPISGIIKDIDIIVPDKVVEVTFTDGLKEKMVCQEEDTFNLRNCLFIAIAKHLYKKDYTFEGIEWKAFELKHLKKYVKIVDSALKAFDKKQKNIAKLEENYKAELESIERKRAKRQAYKERRAAKREQVEKERQIEIQKEAYIQAMKVMEDFKNMVEK